MKKSIKNSLISISFLLIIFTISILTLLTNNAKDVLSQCISKVRESNYQSLPVKLKSLASILGTTYNEDLIFKRQICKLTNLADYRLFHKIDSKAALLGMDNWLFYKTDYDGNPIEDYKGTNPYTEEQLQSIAENVKNEQEKLKKQNIDFQLLLLPNKEEVYSQYMPTDITVANDDKKVDKLSRYLKKNGVNIIDPKEELLQVKDKCQIYYRNDTHWNKLGSFIGTQQINQVILGQREQFDLGKIVKEGITPNCDLLKILELSEYNDDTEFGYLSENRDVQAEYKNIDDIIDEYTSNAKSNKRVLVVGDSFRTALKYWMPEYYSKVDFVHRDNFKSDLIDKLHPDVITYEIVERKTDDLLKPVK